MLINLKHPEGVNIKIIISYKTNSCLLGRTIKINIAILRI